MGVMTPQPVDVINSTLTYDFRLADSYRDPTAGTEVVMVQEHVKYISE